MTHGLIAAVFAAASLLALALLYLGIRRARAAGDLDASCALTLGAGLLITLPDAIVAFTGTLRREYDVIGNLVGVNPSWYHRVDQLMVVLLAGLALALLIPRATSPAAHVNVAALLALLLWAVANLASGLHNGSMLSARAVVLGLCLAAAAVLPRGRGAALGAGIFAVLLAAAGGLLTLFRYDVAFVVPCQGACGGLGFTGVLPNENLLGVALAGSIPLAYLGFRGPVRFWLSLYLAGMAIATGSRTAAGASVILLVALVVLRPRVDAARASVVKTVAALTLLTASVATSVYIVRHHWPPTALTTRPQLWEVAWHHISRAPWFGYGPNTWATLYQSSEIPVYAQRTSHNLWTDVLFVAGGVGVAIFVSMVVTTVWTAGRARSGVLLAFLAISLIGTTEGAWSIGTVDFMTFTLLAILLTGETAPAEQREWIRAPLPRATATARRRRSSAFA